MKQKILIIRFSSFGDLIFAISTVESLKKQFTDSEVHFVTRKDLSSIAQVCSDIDNVWSFDRKSGFLGLIKLGLELRQQGFTHVYDAHSNFRSRILSLIICSSYFIRRSKDRWKRFLLFKLGINKFEQPFRGMHSYFFELKKWGIEIPDQCRSQFDLSKVDFQQQLEITIAPSAAHAMKRWPIDHWKKLLISLPQFKFATLGGPDDQFCDDFVKIDPSRITNFAGKLSFTQSIKAISKSKLVISGDTGLIQVADLLGVAGIDLIGPTAFGFPSNSNIEVLQVPLDCRPCTKDGSGSCSQQVFQKCMVDITPELVTSKIESFFSTPRVSD